MLIDSLRIGPRRTEYRDVRLQLGTYADGDGLAITLVDDETGEPIATATVNVPGEPHSSDDPRLVWIKDWSENEGMTLALSNAGIVDLTGHTVRHGYVDVIEARVTDRTLEHFEAQTGGAA